MAHDIDIMLIAPRYLAGAGDPAWVTVPLHRACRWSTGEDRLTPQVTLTSPDQLAQLRLTPDPEPGAPWWTLRQAHHGEKRAWSMTFGARTPVELIAAVTDALTAPATPPAAPGEPYEPLRSAGWQAPRQHDGHTSDEGMVSPDGLARVDRIAREGGRTSTWVVETSVHDLPALWRAYVDGDTPPHLVGALFAALADTTPLVREPHRVPHLATAHGRTATGRVSADNLGFALEHRTRTLARRHTPPPPVTPPSGPDGPEPRRPR
ncbi:DUF317 domain-containing protein [Streptomyces silvensis]|uniref:DUF317 domain-containing protein n=1 Tax=Streptomyces silvensis TaxID=1765722 RepID=A0A0W7X275_9ACTN|nr:DUF317 domain-containing protein [Streptomyces silvensis]KUF16856.1 hypothetical protein AT728_23400 [Streptomyces silvensis]